MPPQTQPRILKLGHHRLHPEDVILIHTLLRLAPAQGAYQWECALTGPYDAVITDSDHAKTGSGDVVVPAFAGPVLCIDRPLAHAAPSPYRIQRPIRAAQLLDCLNRIAADLTHTVIATGDAPAPASRDSDEPDVASGQIDMQARHKLLRWPSSDLLKNNSQRIRLASLLSRQALRLDELQGITGIPMQECMAFLNEMQSARLLDSRKDLWTPVPAVASTVPVQRTPVPHVPDMQSDQPKYPPRPANALSRLPGKELISHIRKRLGLSIDNFRFKR